MMPPHFLEIEGCDILEVVERAGATLSREIAPLPKSSASVSTAWFVLFLQALINAFRWLVAGKRPDSKHLPSCVDHPIYTETQSLFIFLFHVILGLPSVAP